MAKLEKIVLEVIVEAEAARAWEAFTSPASIVRWNFASPTWHCPRADNDLRAGGTFSYRMEAKDGSFGFDFGGTYTGVEPGRRIAYVLGDGREATVEFIPQGPRTRVVEAFDPEGQNPLEMQRGGWQAILDNYKAVAEGRA